MLIFKSIKHDYFRDNAGLFAIIIFKLLVLNCQCSGLAPALCSQVLSIDFWQYKVEVEVLSNCLYYYFFK